jgi:agmatine/peptidylarginine deiminase
MNYRNAKHISNGRIDCEIEHEVHGWLPYTLDPADTDTTVDNDALLAAIGDDVAAYVAPTQDELDAALAAEVRADRDERLNEVDAVAGNALRWAALDADTQTEWAAYRQALLDVPQQAGFPNNITWPTKT